MPGRLQDKVCVVTGGTSGIGRDTVQRFIEEGAKVVFCGRGEDAGNTIATEMGENCVFMKCDVMVEDEIKAVIEKAVDLWGKLDVLFNNVFANLFKDLTVLQAHRQLNGRSCFGTVHRLVEVGVFHL